MNNYVLIEPVQSRPRVELYSIVSEVNDISLFINSLKANDVVAIDIETTGLELDAKIVGMSMASGHSVIYLPSSNLWNVALQALHIRNIPCIAYNLAFEGYHLRMYRLNWIADVYAIHKLVATENFPGQRWGLKDAQVNLLGWDSKGDVGLDEWLVGAGHYTSSSPGGKDGYVELGGRFYRPDKGKMCLAPVEILGHYCNMDTDSTYQLWCDIFIPFLNRNAEFYEYYTRMWVTHILEHVRQTVSGIKVDRGGLISYDTQLDTYSNDVILKFMNHESVRAHIYDYNANIVSAHEAKEPPRITKSGRESNRWQQWHDKWIRLRDSNHFNVDSGKQLAWLFYDRLKYPVVRQTDGGNPSTDDRALMAFGEPGQLLIKYSEVTKEREYVKAYIEHSGSGVVHPRFKIPGTLTGRLSGSGGISLHQVPKSREFLKNFVARPGRVLTENDHTSIENVVLAELSRDKALWRLYGPGSYPHDAYLFNGCHLGGVKDAILAAGYDLERPTKEDVARIKKECKAERTIAKLCTLSISYGISAGGLMNNLVSSGFPTTYEQAEQMHADYWLLYSGVKDYECRLQKIWRENGGWVRNGVGRPIATHPDDVRKLLNKVIQSTAADIHILYVDILLRRLREAIPKYRWDPIILNFHDESILEVDEEYAEQVARIMDTDVYAELNERLGGEIPIRGGSMIVSNLADIKCE